MFESTMFNEENLLERIAYSIGGGFGAGIAVWIMCIIFIHITEAALLKLERVIQYFRKGTSLRDDTVVKSNYLIVQDSSRGLLHQRHQDEVST